MIWNKELKKKFKDVVTFDNSINVTKETITRFKDRNNTYEEKYKKNKTLPTKFKSFDTIVTIVTSSSSVTLSLIGIGLVAIPISTATACGLSSSN